MNHEFAVHRLNDEGMKKAKLIAESFDGLAKTLSIICIDGRELSICKTKLEEACFFAKKAMAIDLRNQEHQAFCVSSDIPQQDNILRERDRQMKMNSPDEKF